MNTEVELKYLILSEDASSKIKQLFADQQISYEYNVRTLHNCYFDTPDLKLRQLDMGLRIRQYEERKEQTIKTAGSIIGGMHQRPEYNTEISSNFPQLTAFPTEIWPEATDVNALQQELISLFTTHFERQTWLIELDGSQIELALDVGEISADGQVRQINEIELELQHGQVSALFTLANLLFSVLSLRAGSHSKAARGYRLFAKTPYVYQSALLFTGCDEGDKSVQQWFMQGLGHYLQQLQLSIGSYLAKKSLTSLSTVVEVLTTMRHGFWLHDELITDECRAIRHELSHFIQLFAWVDSAIYVKEIMDKTGNYRKKVEYSQQLVEELKLEKRRFPDSSMVKELLYSERFNQLQVSLLQLILSDNHSAYFIQDKNDQPLVNFARLCMSESLTELHASINEIDAVEAEQYLDKRKVLHRCLLTGNWFGYLFDQQHRQQFRGPWLDMQQGLSELQSLWIIKQQLEKLDDENESVAKVITWQHSKVDNLLVALSHTKDAALSLPAYW